MRRRPSSQLLSFISLFCGASGELHLSFILGGEAADTSAAELTTVVVEVL
jgi:hypothetical protein